MSRSIGGFTSIRTLVNAESRNREGTFTPALWENASVLPVSQFGDLSEEEGLISLLSHHTIEIRLPWARLNFSDPTTATVLFDPIADSRNIITTDSLDTKDIQTIKLWAVGIGSDGDLSYWPSEDSSLTVELPPWHYPETTEKPKLAFQVLADFLNSWNPLGD